MNEIVFVEKETVAMRVRISPEVQKSRDERVAGHVCLGCEKKHPESVRYRCGQCPTCYVMTRKAINKRKITKTELIREGKLLPNATAGRKPTNPYSKMLNDR